MPSSTSSTSATARRRTPRKGKDQNGTVPLPAAHPHRSPPRGPPTTNGTNDTNNNPFWSEVGSQWGSLQSVASTLLSSDSSALPTAAKAKSNGSWFSDLLTPAPPPQQNQASSSGRGDIYPRARRRGPTAPTFVTAPTSAAEDRRRKKRVSTSPPPSPSTTQPTSQDEETLVYIYHVTSASTTEGVVIAFDTTAAAVHRANGLWPGDGVQSRKELMVPVDECRVKGIPIAEPEPEPPTTEKPEMRRHFTDPPPPPPPPLQPPEDDGDGDAPYKPVSHVLLPGLGPTTIARLNRKKLSHFPPPRHAHHHHHPSSSLSLATSPQPLIDPSDPTRLLPDSGPLSPASTFGGRTPGVHSLRPEREADGSKELVESLATGVGVVEGWIRGWGKKVREGGGEVFEMVTQMGVDEEERVWMERRAARKAAAAAAIAEGRTEGRENQEGEARDRRRAAAAPPPPPPRVVVGSESERGKDD